MLILEALDEHGRPVIVRASRVVVREAVTNTPIAVAATFGEQSVMAASAVDPEFQKLLRALRVNDTVLVTTLGPKDIVVPQIL